MHKLLTLAVASILVILAAVVWLGPDGLSERAALAEEVAEECKRAGYPEYKTTGMGVLRLGMLLAECRKEAKGR